MTFVKDYLAEMDFLPAGDRSTGVIFDGIQTQKYKLYRTEILHVVHSYQMESMVRKSGNSKMMG